MGIVNDLDQQAAVADAQSIGEQVGAYYAKLKGHGIPDATAHMLAMQFQASLLPAQEVHFYHDMNMGGMGEDDAPGY